MDRHELLAQTPPRKLRHVISTNIQSSLSAIQVNTALDVGGGVSAGDDKDLCIYVRTEGWDGGGAVRQIGRKMGEAKES